MSFDNLLDTFSSEVSKDLSKLHGSKFVSRLSKDKPDFVSCVRQGIYKDDFGSLAQLTPQQLFNNKALILDALKYANIHNKSDIGEFKQFLLTSLSPVKKAVDIKENDNVTKINANYYFDEDNYNILANIFHDMSLWDQIDVGTIHKRLLRSDLRMMLNQYAKFQAPIDTNEINS